MLPPLLALLIASCGDSAASRDEATPAPGTAANAVTAFDHHIEVDQFGYRPDDPKVAVIRNPQVGYDSADKFTPGSTYQVRRISDGSVVFSGKPMPWRQGAVETSSGDNGWWFDFSPVIAPGRYTVYDVERGVAGAPFAIDEHVYRDVLKASLRMFYYQRSGIAKTRPYADACWVDGPAYLGPDQDTQAHDITDPDNRAKFRNLAGGWFDAGDTNKYVTFAAQPVHQLLTAYTENPQVFTDDFNIPESGNGVPDVLDEVKWETDWLKRMQYPNGSAALKVGEIVYSSASPPSSDHNTRYYIPSCTSGTIAVAGMFAHAAFVFGGIAPLATEAAELKARAIAAWNNYESAPAKQTHCDTDVVHAGNADWSETLQDGAAVTAAVYLYAITDSPAYGDYVKAHVKDSKPYHDAGWSRYNPDQGEALLFYTTLPHADPSLRRSILDDKLADARSAHDIYGFRPDDDLYRDFLLDAQYHWGSNNPRAAYGNTNIDMITYHVSPDGTADYTLRALETLHYFHGVNPLSIVYLSNMRRYGASRSVNQLFHAWYAPRTKWNDALTSACGPAPGYVPGGPNMHAADNGVPTWIAPPTGQPAQKSYKDWNIGMPEKSWAINEPAIYYQSGYVKLLSKFAR